MSFNDHKALYILDVYTTHSIPLWSHNHHKSYSQHYWRVATSYYHQGGTSCQSQSKLSRGLWVLWVNTPVLWIVLSHTTTLPSCKTRQDMADPQGYRNRPCWLQQFVQIQTLLIQPDPETHLSIFVILPYTTVTHDLSEVLAWSVSL